MNYNKNAAGTLLPMTVTEGVTVNLLPSPEHVFLMTTREVAAGYGVTKYWIQKAFLRYNDELTAGKHFIKGVDYMSTPGMQPTAILWTKRGIVRLGFFIRSERARLFRDWAEDLVLSALERPALSSVPAALPASPSGRKINRLTPGRVADLLADVCLIENKELRERIAIKVTGGYSYGSK